MKTASNQDVVLVQNCSRYIKMRGKKWALRSLQQFGGLEAVTRGFVEQLQNQNMFQIPQLQLIL